MNFDLTYSVMLPLLEAFQKATHSYGWAIILLTLLVRAIVWPFVQSSTKSMKRMSQLQPQMKLIQERYKEDPQLLQQKTMEFYQKNKLNPVGGCLPMLVQLPILFALYGAFCGPPFCEKPIDTKVTVVAQADASKAHADEVSKATVQYVDAQGKLAKLVMFPGEETVVQGQSVEFHTRAVDGTVPADFQVGWKVVPKGKDPHNITPTLGSTFTTTFDTVGEYHVQAEVPAVAKNEPFLFIRSLGKVARGVELLKPENWDSLVLIVLFGATMYLSQKYTVSTPTVSKDQMDEQQLIQQQTMKTMPIAMTVMFFFIPLPTGVFLYMVVSNVVQTMQTMLIMRQPVAPLVDVLDDSPVTMSSGGSSADDNGKFQSEKPKKQDHNGKPSADPKKTGATNQQDGQTLDTKDKSKARKKKKK